MSPHRLVPRPLALAALLAAAALVGAAALTVSPASAGPGRGPGGHDHGHGDGHGQGQGHGQGHWPAANEQIVTSTDRPGKTFSLTFDDGPNPIETEALLRVLRSHHVPAVFCLWGDHVVDHPEVVREIAADGHVLCNHTMHHDDMGAWTADRVRADLEQTSAVIHDAAPGEPIRYFRAPYGSWGRTPQVAASLGLQPLGWRYAITDWEPPGADVLLQRLLDGATPQAVVLTHDGGGERSQTVVAVDAFITRMQADGWRFVLPAKVG